MKKTVEEFIYFILIQASNYILPLFTFPYLIRVFGMGVFGEYVLIQTVLSYFILLVDFGFNLTGVKKISQANSSDELSNVFNSIISAKLILILISVIIFLIASLFIPHVQTYKVAYLCALPILIGQATFPIWYYQAIQKMRVATLINVGIKIFFTGCIFLLVKGKGDFNLALLINSVGFLLGGIIAISSIYKSGAVALFLPKMKAIIIELKDSWRVFLSSVFTSLYSSTNILVLAYFKNPIMVGQYSAADKVFRALYNVTIPFIQVFFPKQAKWYSTSKIEYIKNSKKIFMLLMAICILIGIGTYVMSPLIVRIVTGSDDVIVVSVLRIFSLSAVLYPFGSFFTNMLTIQNLNHVLLKAVSLSALINCIFVVPIIYYFSIEGLAFLSFITQIFIFTYKGVNIIKNLNQQQACVESAA